MIGFLLSRGFSRFSRYCSRKDGKFPKILPKSRALMLHKIAFDYKFTIQSLSSLLWEAEHFLGHSFAFPIQQYTFVLPFEIVKCDINIEGEWTSVTFFIHFGISLRHNESFRAFCGCCDIQNIHQKKRFLWQGKAPSPFEMKIDIKHL